MRVVRSAASTTDYAPGAPGRRMSRPVWKEALPVAIPGRDARQARGPSAWWSYANAAAKRSREDDGETPRW